ncbi:uncharacterized protein NPIL_307111 [Nephila pilipes]|uniref:DNA-directed DNA polymerase n=1 Tax=Nephila pilipes TaxID=299642 RepID=A0A8X6NFQ2_NEPPI|nr:uncharacterized protein NPIL_307111 [Nephila pilipes]
MSRASLTLNKPIAVGMSILDISKTLMYEFHYHKMKACYGENVKLFYTDTDSFIYDIKCDDIYNDIKNDLFDTSDYPTDNIYGIPRKNKKVLGKMKDENCGVKKSTLEKKIDFEDYRRCLLKDINLYSSMNLIRSVNHDIYTVTLNKLALSAHDEKSKNPDIMETVDTKQENYQNQSTDKVDKTNTITSISPKEHVVTRPKDEANAEGIEEEIGNIAPGKYKNIPKKILNFIQQNHGEIYWTPDKELIVDGKIIRNTNIINLITHLASRGSCVLSKDDKNLDKKDWFKDIYFINMDEKNN